MCFIINEKYPIERIANKDIVCYKRLDRGFRSPYRCKLYKLNKLYKNKLILQEKPFGSSIICFIDIGIHSYSCKKVAKQERWLHEIIVKSIIPKGSRYYYNPIRHEYVSNKIIIQEVIK